MCKYVIVITVFVRQAVDGHFGTTLRLPTGMLRTIMSANLQSDNNQSIHIPMTGFSKLCRFTALWYAYVYV